MKTKEKLALLLVLIVLVLSCFIDVDSSTDPSYIEDAKVQAEINRMSK